MAGLEALDELYQFMALDARGDLRGTAMEIVLGLTASPSSLVPAAKKVGLERTRAVAWQARIRMVSRSDGPGALA